MEWFREISSVSNVAVDLFNTSLQVVGASPIKKKWLIEKLFQEEDKEGYECREGKGWLGFPDLWSGQNPDGTYI